MYTSRVCGKELIHSFLLTWPHRQGGLTWLWLDSPYVITARKLFNMAVASNDAGNPFPVSHRLPLLQYLPLPCRFSAAQRAVASNNADDPLLLKNLRQTSLQQGY